MATTLATLQARRDAIYTAMGLTTKQPSNAGAGAIRSQPEMSMAALSVQLKAVNQAINALVGSVAIKVSGVDADEDS